MMKKIGLYGGTFDPPHNAHIQLAEWVFSELKLDLLYFIPAATHALKDNLNITPIEIRYDMVNKAIGNYPNFKVSRIEIDKERISYTVETLRDFEKYEKINKAKLFFIIGIDNLIEFHHWKNHNEIFDLVSVIVMQRPGFYDAEIKKQYADKVTYLDSPLLDISSTEIRNRIKHCMEIKKLVPGEVYNLIRRHNLYQSK